MHWKHPALSSRRREESAKSQHKYYPKIMPVMIFQEREREKSLGTRSDKVPQNAVYARQGNRRQPKDRRTHNATDEGKQMAPQPEAIIKRPPSTTFLPCFAFRRNERVSTEPKTKQCEKRYISQRNSHHPTQLGSAHFLPEAYSPPSPLPFPVAPALPAAARHHQPPPPYSLPSSTAHQTDYSRSSPSR